jgi:hypothetical protein
MTATQLTKSPPEADLEAEIHAVTREALPWLPLILGIVTLAFGVLMTLAGVQYQNVGVMLFGTVVGGTGFGTVFSGTRFGASRDRAEAMFKKSGDRRMKVAAQYAVMVSPAKLPLTLS